MGKWLYAALAGMLIAPGCKAQTDTDSKDVTISGSIQADALVPQTDEAIHSERGDSWARPTPMRMST